MYEKDDNVSTVARDAASTIAGKDDCSNDKSAPFPKC